VLPGGLDVFRSARRGQHCCGHEEGPTDDGRDEANRPQYRAVEDLRADARSVAGSGGGFSFCFFLGLGYRLGFGLAIFLDVGFGLDVIGLNG
jgi:hypothetical protein